MGDGYVLDDFVFALAQRARHRLGMSLDHGGAHDRQWALRGAADLELEQALAGLGKLALRALGLTPVASGSRLFGHVAGPLE